MKTRLPEYYIVTRDCRDTRSPGRIHSGYMTRDYAERRRQELLKACPNANFWIFEWDSPEIEQIKQWEGKL